MDDLIIRAAIIDELSAPLDRITTDISHLAREVARLDRTASRASAATSKMGRAGSAAGSAAAAHAAQLAKVRARADEMNRSFERVVARGGRQMLNFARRGAQAFGIMGAAITAVGSNAALSLQDARKAFANFTTDPEGLTRRIQGLDATKALGITRTANIGAQLGAFGIKDTDIPDAIASLTDAAYLKGSKGAEARIERIGLALGQVQAKGRIMAEEALQFAEAGVPIYARLATAIGVTQAQLLKMLSTPGKSAQIFDQIGGAAGLARVIGGGTAKGAALRAVTGTVRGAVGSAKNRFAGAAAIGAQPTLDRLAKLVFANEAGLSSFEKTITRVVGSGLPRLVDAVLGFWGRNGRTIRREVRLLISDVRDFARFAGPVLADGLAVAVPVLLGMAHAVGFLSRVLRPFSGFLAPLVAGFAAFTVLNKAATAVKGFTLAMRALALTAYANPYVLIGAAVVALVVGLVVLYRRSERFRNIVNAIGRFGKAAFGGMVDGIKSFISWVRQAIDWVANLYDRIPGPIKRVLNLIVPGAAAVDVASSLPPPGGPSRLGNGATAARPSPSRTGGTVEPVTVQSNNTFVDGLQRREVERIAGEEAGKAYDSRDRAKRER